MYEKAPDNIVVSYPVKFGVIADIENMQTLLFSFFNKINEGKKITAADLQPGDLIFYGGSSGSINHVAMYIGGGKVIHASSPKTGIKISNYTYRTPVKYVSIIKE